MDPLHPVSPPAAVVRPAVNAADRFARAQMLVGKIGQAERMVLADAFELGRLLVAMREDSTQGEFEKSLERLGLSKTAAWEYRLIAKSSAPNISSCTSIRQAVEVAREHRDAAPGGAKPVVVAHGEAGYLHAASGLVVCERCHRVGKPVPSCAACLRVRASYREQEAAKKKAGRRQEKNQKKAQRVLALDPAERLLEALLTAHRSCRQAADDVKALLACPEAADRVRPAAEKYRVPLEQTVADAEPGRPVVWEWPAVAYLPAVLGEVAEGMKADVAG